MRRQVGIIYGSVSGTAFDLAVSDPDLKRLDYVEVEWEGHRVLAQVEAVERRSNLSFDDAMQMDGAADTDDRLSASARVIGFVADNGRIQTPGTPLRGGIAVDRADQALVTTVLGLEADAASGAFLGHVVGSKIPVTLSLEMLAQKHVSVLAKTGAGKSYTVGVLLEEFLRAGVPLVVLDPHGEYGSLRHANIDPDETATMVRFKVKPKSFADRIEEFALDTQLNPDARRLVLEGMNLEGREIVDLLGGKLSGGQVGVLYQAVKEVKEYLPAYTLRDIMDGVARNKSSARWNVLNALEALDATKVFDIRGTPVTDIVKPGRCTIINLKGATPDIQDIVVTRLTSMLWEARKRNEVPPHILVVEEAHNFCPERNVGNAVSGGMIRTVASEGRKFGLGLVIVSQRPAKVDKNVLSQCNTQLVLKVTNPNDLKAIVQSVEGISPGAADEVSRLPVGSALVAGGGLTQPVFVEVRPRLTKHGGRSVSVLAPPELAPRGAAATAGRAPPPTPAPAPSQPIAAPPPRQAAPNPPPPATQAPTTRAASAPVTPPAAPRRATADTAARPALAPTGPMANPARPARREGPIPYGTFPHTSRSRPVEAPPPAEGPSFSSAAALGIHRVAGRVGLVGPANDPEETIRALRLLARQNGRDSEARLRLYKEIAEHACHDSNPACARCPLSAQCQHHQRLQGERQRPTETIRRLWKRT